MEIYDRTQIYEKMVKISIVGRGLPADNKKSPLLSKRGFVVAKASGILNLDLIRDITKIVDFLY